VYNPKEMFAKYEAIRDKWLPEPQYEKVVSERRQKEEIKLLKETMHFERFFFVFNMQQLSLREVHGFQQWLGYPDKDFTVHQFLKIIHPQQNPAHHITAAALLEGLMRGDWPVEFMKYRFISNIALRHANGNYLLCKRLGSVFQHDTKGRLLEYINEFTIVGEYKEEPYTVRLINDKGEKHDWMEDVMNRLKAAFENKNLFGFQELRILRKYAYKPGILNAEIATSFKIKPSTVITYNKRILNKAEDLFKTRFDTAAQVGLFLRDQGLL
jgi:hypothetical protein